MVDDGAVPPLPGEVPLVKSGRTPVEVYEDCLRAGYIFRPHINGDHIKTEVFSPPYQRHMALGNLFFRRGELAKISAYEPGIGLGTALVGSAMSFYNHKRWVFSTGFRDENGRLFASHLASSPGIELGYRSEGQDWFPTHGIPTNFAVPRRRWVLVSHTREIERYGYCESGKDSEAAAIARKLIQRAEGNHSQIVMPSFLYPGLAKALFRAREYLLDPPVLTASGRELSLNMRGHRYSHSPVPAVAVDGETYERAYGGSIPNVITFIERRDEPLEAARLFY